MTTDTITLEDLREMITDALEWGAYFSWFDPAFLYTIQARLDEGMFVSKKQIDAVLQTHKMLRTNVYG